MSQYAVHIALRDTYLLSIEPHRQVARLNETYLADVDKVSAT